MVVFKQQAPVDYYLPHACPLAEERWTKYLEGRILKSSFPQGALHIPACCLDINISPKPPTSSSVMGFAPLHPCMKILTGWLYMDNGQYIYPWTMWCQIKTTWALPTMVETKNYVFAFSWDFAGNKLQKKYKKLRKLRKVDFLEKKAKLVSNIWNKGTIFVKIFRCHEILADVRGNICSCENICFP